MAQMCCKTKGNANPKGKPRVYFTCHPDDFDRYFDKICEDIFKTHDCGIFYTEDMNAVIAEEDKATDLESNNLFIVPVTFRLLFQPNRAMDTDIPFALEKHIPVLPFMMEPGIDKFYAEKFGELQYLSPYSTDATEISYEEKLKKYLESVLISDEMAKRVRAAFDAYIFLSYRKKDRRYANELMRLIHSHPEFWDIAIWYDEFLTPGESFRENIAKILSDSKLFALLVTPNLLEEPDGKPNYVMGQEYPAAKKSGIDILPAEMEETDRDTLHQKYEGIPPCINPHDEAFKARLLESIAKIATTANESEPMHNFLIGLAYLKGIDVEIDHQRGLGLVISAAEQSLPEAMEALYRMYSNGDIVRLDHKKAAFWGEKIADYQRKCLGTTHPDTLITLDNLVTTYCTLWEYRKALALMKEVYEIQRQIYGLKDPDTLFALGKMAAIYGKLGEYEEALKLSKMAYELQCEVQGEEHIGTLLTLNSIATCYGYLGDEDKYLELTKKVYFLRCKTLGENHPHTMSSLEKLAYFCYGNGDAKAIQMFEKAYAFRCETLGEEHPDTICTLYNLGEAYSMLPMLQDAYKAKSLMEKAYNLQCKVLGEDHPSVDRFLGGLTGIYGQLGEYAKAVEVLEKWYATQCKWLGEDHIDSIKTLVSLKNACQTAKQYEKELEYGHRHYVIACRKLGPENPAAFDLLHEQAIVYNRLGNYKKALEMMEKLHGFQLKVFGREHLGTKQSEEIIAFLQKKTGEVP